MINGNIYSENLSSQYKKIVFEGVVLKLSQEDYDKMKQLFSDVKPVHILKEYGGA